MERPQQRHSVGEFGFSAMRELRSGWCGSRAPREVCAVPFCNGLNRCDCRVERHASEGDNDPHSLQQFQLPKQVGPAVSDFFRQRFVRRRRAVNRRRDVAVAQPQAVVTAHRCWFVSEAGPVQRREEPVAAAVTGEYAARAIAAVGCGCESDDQQTRSRITEARHRTAPVVVVIKAPDLFTRDPRSPLNQTRAQVASDDSLL